MATHDHQRPSLTDDVIHGEGAQRHAETEPSRFWTSKAGLAAIGFLVIAAVLLVSEHRLHALGYLPFLLLLACPFLHIFVHRGHAGHGGSIPPQRANED